jgi:UDP-glucose 4-epimerase
MLFAAERTTGKFEIYNLGTDEYCEVNDSVGWISGVLGVAPALTYGGGDRGWIGDNPFIFLDTAKIRSLGWRPKLTIREGVLRTVDYLQGHAWLLDRRG